MKYQQVLNSDISLFWEGGQQPLYLSAVSIKQVTWYGEDANAFLVSRLPAMDFFIKDLKLGDKLHIQLNDCPTRDRFDEKLVFFSLEIQELTHRLNHLSPFGPNFQDLIEAKTFLKAKIVWGAIGNE